MEKNKNEFLKNIKRTWQYIKDCKLNLVGYGLVSMTEAVLGAILPLVSAQIILNITSGVMEQLILSAIAVFLIGAVLYTMFYFKGFLFQKIYQKTLNGLQIAVAKETLRLEISEIDKSSSGLFIDRLNRDTQDISSMFMGYTYWISYVISNVGILVAIFVLNRYLFVFSLIASILIFFINKTSLSKQYKVQKELKILQEKKDWSYE